MKADLKTRDLVMTALLSSLVFIFTRFVNITLPVSMNGGGLIHLGNVIVVIGAIVFGSKKAAVSGALGMTIFDITAGYAIWAPFTCVIRLLSGYVIGNIANNTSIMKNNSTLKYILAVIMGGAVIVSGYFVTALILFQNIAVSLTSLPGDIIQVVVGGAVGIPIAIAMKKYPMFNMNAV